MFCSFWDILPFVSQTNRVEKHELLTNVTKEMKCQTLCYWKIHLLYLSFQSVTSDTTSWLLFLCVLYPVTSLEESTLLM